MNQVRRPTPKSCPSSPGSSAISLTSRDTRSIVMALPSCGMAQPAYQMKKNQANGSIFSNKIYMQYAEYAGLGSLLTEDPNNHFFQLNTANIRYEQRMIRGQIGYTQYGESGTQSHFLYQCPTYTQTDIPTKGHTNISKNFDIIP